MTATEDLAAVLEDIFRYGTTTLTWHTPRGGRPDAVRRWTNPAKPADSLVIDGEILIAAHYGTPVAWLRDYTRAHAVGRILDFMGAAERRDMVREQEQPLLLTRCQEYARRLAELHDDARAGAAGACYGDGLDYCIACGVDLDGGQRAEPFWDSSARARRCADIDDCWANWLAQK
ncbi:MAG: hypothetical protein ACREQ5_15375 [Candidatus Dormibacteria bacterium]